MTEQAVWMVEEETPAELTGALPDAPTTPAVDLLNLPAEHRKALIEQLKAKDKADREARKAEREARKAAKQSAPKEDNSAQHEHVLSDVAHKVIQGTPMQTTASKPVGFWRYTGKVTVDGVAYNITVTAQKALR